MRLRIVLSALALCAGCAAIDTDWYAIGMRDGRLGAYPQDDYLASRFGTPTDRERYLRGWQDGAYSRRSGARNESMKEK